MGYRHNRLNVREMLACMEEADETQLLLRNSPVEVSALEFNKMTDSNGKITRTGRPIIFRTFCYRTFYDSPKVWRGYIAITAYNFSRLVGFVHAIPAATRRSVDYRGKPYDGWIQDAPGRNLGDAMDDLQIARRVHLNYKDAWSVISSNPMLMSSLEEALLCRFLIGEVDNYVGNFTVDISQPPRFINSIDFEHSFPGNWRRQKKKPIWGRCTNHANHLLLFISDRMSRRPLSEHSLDLLSDFSKHTRQNPGIFQTMGLCSDQSASLVCKTDWFLKKKRFPGTFWENFFHGQPPDISEYLQSIER